MGNREPIDNKERERLTDLLADFAIDSYFNLEINHAYDNQYLTLVRNAGIS